MADKLVSPLSIADVEAAWAALEAAFNAEKSQLEAIVASHIGSHQAQAAAHNAEASAATAILHKINPPAQPAPQPASPPPIILTAVKNDVSGIVAEARKVETEVEGFWSKASKLWDAGWRYAFLASAAAFIFWEVHKGLIK